ncbi:LysM peptidoglycan-binding domain-containing protein [Pleurocapsa sp. FMAR1]|uniref:LysM peptidoglycan-binding domain-containing protein n=1 Tax=Pleurocapsa sp. FMAR1 TaxID=3040204 RepID=UPI0029C8EEBD|nr:LysM domain-containing protein [Pleurocapsa sp. FMAR1]
MSVKLTCPVCDRSQIEDNTCPNCETNLSTYRMLAELPVETPVERKEQKRTIPLWLPVGVAILFLLLGIGLGFAGNSVIAKQQPKTTPTSTTASNQTSETKADQLVVSPTVVEKPQGVEKSESKSCGGFNYVVRKGDSLSLIASRLYGDINSWSLISKANPAIQGRESSIEIGELLFVPNLKNNCQNI